MKMKINWQPKLPERHVLAAALALMSAPLIAAVATTPEQRGFEISARSDRSDRGYKDSVVELEMILRNASGQESRRQLAVNTLEVPDESVGDKSVIVFRQPRDINGTALLSHAKILDPDNQWLYLPSLKRVKRISSVNKSGPFVGSEFAYEDLTALELNKYDYKFLRTEACGKLKCDVVERYPRYEYSGYTRQISWIDQTAFQVRKVEYYDRRGDLLKTLIMNKYRVYPGKIWRSHHYLMKNHQTGKSTELHYSDYAFGKGLDDGDFNKNVLKRIR